MANGNISIVLIGAGNMGGAMLQGWLAKGIPTDALTIVDPAPNAAVSSLIAEHNLHHVPSPPDDLTADVVIIALKPQIIDAALPALQKLLGPATVCVSVAAGKTLASLAEGLGNTAIVRAMPNTPAQVQRGITVCVGNNMVTDRHRTVITDLLKSIGEVAWIEEETLIDAVTGLSGSGPAYVFHMVEAMAEAGIAAGLPKDLADSLARATVCGAGELMHQSALPPGELRKNVTSPNGTTQAALEVLMADDGLTRLMTRAVAAAAKRAGELAK